MLLTLILDANGQEDSVLMYTFNKENVVASAIDGSWESENEEMRVPFQKDTSILKLIPNKYYKYLKNKVIYHAGFFTIKGKTLAEDKESKTSFFAEHGQTILQVTNESGLLYRWLSVRFTRPDKED